MKMMLIAAVCGVGLALGSLTAHADSMPRVAPPEGGGAGYPSVRQLPPLPPVRPTPPPYQKFLDSPVKPQFSPPGVTYTKRFP